MTDTSMTSGTVNNLPTVATHPEPCPTQANLLSMVTANDQSQAGSLLAHKCKGTSMATIQSTSFSHVISNSPSNITTTLKKIKEQMALLCNLLDCLEYKLTKPIPAPKIHWKSCPSDLIPHLYLLKTHQSFIPQAHKGQLLHPPPTQPPLPCMNTIQTMTKTTVTHGCQAALRTKASLHPP